MSFWLRELGGWLLVLVGLFLFYKCLFLLVEERPPGIIEVIPLTVIGIIVFRGGIHLLKVAVAARICARTPERLDSRSSGSAPSRRAPGWVSARRQA